MSSKIRNTRKTRAVSFVLFGLLLCAGCEDDPMDLDYLKDSGVDAATDSGSGTTTPAMDAGQNTHTDAAVGSGNDAGSDDAGSDAG